MIERVRKSRARHTFSLGNGVDGAGSESRTPLGVDVIGQVLRSWFKSACAPSRAVAARSSSRLSFNSSGLGSFARSSPRSNVYGVGLFTMTGSFVRFSVSAMVKAY